MQKNASPPLRLFPPIQKTESIKLAALEGDLEALDTLVENSLAGDPAASIALCSVLQSRVWALHRLGWLIFEETHGPILQALIGTLKFKVAEYQKSVDEQPNAYLPFLCNLADFGYFNVRDLLVALAGNGNEEVFFAFVGIAANGSFWALHAINEGGTEGHFHLLAQYAEKYRDNPRFGKPLLGMIQNPDFKPRCYLARPKGPFQPTIVQSFAKLGAPFAVTLLQNASLAVH